jgi:hypothetical protein
MWAGSGMPFNLGDCSNMAGLELNFWLLPSLTAGVYNSTNMVQFLSYIQLNYQVFLAPDQTVMNGIIMTYAGATYNVSFVQPATPQWINVNLRVQFGSYIIMGVWIGYENLNI